MKHSKLPSYLYFLSVSSMVNSLILSYDFSTSKKTQTLISLSEYPSVISCCNSSRRFIVDLFFLKSLQCSSISFLSWTLSMPRGDHFFHKFAGIICKGDCAAGTKIQSVFVSLFCQYHIRKTNVLKNMQQAHQFGFLAQPQMLYNEKPWS